LQIPPEDAEQHFLLVGRELLRALPRDHDLAVTVCRESQRAYVRLLEAPTTRGMDLAMQVAREAGEQGGRSADQPWAWEDEAVLDVLRQRLTESGRWQAEASVDQLVAIGAAAVPLLLEVLATSESLSTRRRVLTVLEAMPESPQESLLEMLAGEQPWYLQRNALYVLRRRGDAAGAPSARTLARRGEPRVRQEAVLYLLAIDDEDRLRVLDEALADHDHDLALVLARLVLKQFPTREAIMAVARRSERVPPDLVGGELHMGLLVALAATRQPQALHFVAEVPARRQPVLPWQRQRYKRDIEAMVRRER
jgi:HEAT repeat protein